MRASDVDREGIVHVLRNATAHGMLTLEECDQRMAAAYGARFLHELSPLVADLPPAPTALPAAPGWRAVTTTALVQARASLSAAPWGAALRSRSRLAACVALLATLPLPGVQEVGDLLGIDLLDD